MADSTPVKFRAVAIVCEYSEAKRIIIAQNANLVLVLSKGCSLLELAPLGSLQKSLD